MSSTTTTTSTTTTSTTSMTSSRSSISLAIPYPDLFGCGLEECSLDDNVQGGTAVFNAYARYHHNSTNNNNNNDNDDDHDEERSKNSLLIVPIFDYQSGFVQMHPLEWSVNRLVFERYGFQSYIGIPCLLLSHYVDSTFASKRDLTDLLVSSSSSSSPSLLPRPIYSNVLVPPSNSWREVLDHIYFDYETNFAILSLIDQSQPLAYKQNDAAEGLLRYVGNINRRMGCTIGQQRRSSGGSGTDHQLTPYEIYTFPFATTATDQQQTMESPENNGNSNNETNNCWIPIVILHGADTTAMDTLLDSLDRWDFPPAAIIDTQASLTKDDGNLYYETPTKLSINNKNDNSTSATWVVSYFIEPTRFDMLRFDIIETTETETGTTEEGEDSSSSSSSSLSSNPLSSSSSSSSSSRRRTRSTRRFVEITNLELVQDSMVPVAEYIRNDTQFQQDFEFTSNLVREALDNDPVVATMDMPMPLSSKPPDVYHCFAGECPIGNLFTDAARWKAGADLAIINAGGVRGPGWDAGSVHVSDMWAALPFANMLCEATLSGLSLVRMFNYSTAMGAFESDKYVQDADRFMQVSGARVTYNTQLPDTGRLVSVEIWNTTLGTYEPVERLRLYKLASSSWECSGFYPFTEFLGGNLTMEGEIPASTTEELMQDVVGEYLGQLNVNGTSYDASIQGRLVDNNDAWGPMSWDQSKDGCTTRTYWVERYLTCMDCPSTSKVTFTKSTVELIGESMMDESLEFEVNMINGEPFPVSLIPKTNSVPEWVVGQTDGLITLQPFEEHTFQFEANAVSLDAGTAQATVSFTIQDGGSFPGCSGDDVDFQVMMRVEPQAELNKPENIRYAGFALMSILCIVSVCFAGWLFRHRQHNSVRARQPELYFVFLAGCFILSLSILPFSIVDELDSSSGKDQACMAVPWLLFTGFNLMMTSLYAKLWRLNKIFHVGSHRRISVTSKQALSVCGIVFAVNVVLLVIWTAVGPLRWEIHHVPGEEWNRYGSCSLTNTAGRVMFWLTFASSAIILCLTAFQATRARNISDEYSESKQLGFAVFTASQIVIVSIPILFLISRENPDARYLLQTLIIFAVGMSVTLLVFVPVIHQYRQKNAIGDTRTSTIRVSGHNFNGMSHGSLVSISQAARSSILGSGSAQQGSNELLGSCHLHQSSKNLISSCTTSSREHSTSHQRLESVGEHDEKLSPQTDDDDEQHDGDHDNDDDDDVAANLTQQTTASSSEDRSDGSGNTMFRDLQQEQDSEKISSKV